MNLFVSYARVDKPYAMDIINVLQAHEIWYDQRLYVGQQWWTEILRRLEWCDGFIYLLSPDSVKSEYCTKEFELALSLGRYIFPVLIHPQTEIPEKLLDTQYVDMTAGISVANVRDLLNSITEVERKSGRPDITMDAIDAEKIQQPRAALDHIIGDIATAMGNGHYDRVLYLIKIARDSGQTSDYINLERLEDVAEAELQKQVRQREIDRSYIQIAALVKQPRTREIGCDAFRAFQRHNAGYDPQGLSQYCQPEPEPAPALTNGDTQTAPRILMPPRYEMPHLEWVQIPAGNVQLMVPTDDKQGAWQTRLLDAFFISKYPVTNEQFNRFVTDETGYHDPRWWDFNEEALAWHAKHPQPRDSRFHGPLRPREIVNWYEAIAFCRWLTAKTGMSITLPTEWQWTRAARGDSRASYPNCKPYLPDHGNTSESEIKMTTSVDRYVEGQSVFGVFDMIGNTWEWCLNTRDMDPALDLTGEDVKRAVHGGSYMGPANRAKVDFRYYLSPRSAAGNVGFRIVHNLTENV